MLPYGGLPENLAGFCAVLRRDHRFHIGAGELLDAARALDVVPLSDRRSVRHALRAVLACTRDEAAAFDPAFDRFFLQTGLGLPPRVPEGDNQPLREPASDRPIHARMRDRPPDDAAGWDDDFAGATRRFVSGEEETGEPVGFIGARYSPIQTAGDGAPDVEPAGADWAAAARTLVARLRLGLSRRWQPSRRGRRFDARRTLRASVRTGGEPLNARWLNRRRRAPRLVMLIDGSRSMAGHAAAALRLAVALASATSRLTVFTFSTGVQQVTAQVGAAAQGRSCALPARAFAWGGGTRIGGSLAAFLRRFGERLIRRDTVVFIVSDGLEVGEAGELRTAMSELQRRSAGIVWLNPLLDTPGYEPTAVGMRIALPYVSTFVAVNDVEGLVRLSRRARVTRPAGS
jgi:uncharacterized protein with von Willebrand factor type A (vWA) domain